MSAKITALKQRLMVGQISRTQTWDLLDALEAQRQALEKIYRESRGLPGERGCDGNGDCSRTDCECSNHIARAALSDPSVPKTDAVESAGNTHTPPGSDLAHICETQRVAIELLRNKLALKERGTDGFGSTGIGAADSGKAEATSHAYISTACHHGKHDYCRTQCKFCDVRCGCECGHPKAMCSIHHYRHGECKPAAPSTESVLQPSSSEPLTKEENLQLVTLLRDANTLISRQASQVETMRQALEAGIVAFRQSGGWPNFVAQGMAWSKMRAALSTDSQKEKPE